MLDVTIGSAEARVGVLDETAAAVLLDGAVGVGREVAVLDVELLQPAAVVGHQHHALVRHRLARLEAQLAQLRAELRQHLQPLVRHVALAHVQ